MRSFSASNDIFGDPLPGVLKTLTISLKIKGQVKTSTVVEFTGQAIDIPNGNLVLNEPKLKKKMDDFLIEHFNDE